MAGTSWLEESHRCATMPRVDDMPAIYWDRHGKSFIIRWDDDELCPISHCPWCGKKLELGKPGSLPSS